jgi:hypothetical protein
MSEAEVRPDPETETPEGEDAETEAEEQESEGEEGEEDGEDEAAARVKRAEAQAHDKAGLAAKERSKRRAAERQFSELQQRFEALESKVSGGERDELSDLIASLRDDDDEPITDLNQIKRVLKTFMKQQADDAKASGQRQQHVKQTNVLLSTMDAYEKDFVAEAPDYYKAADYVRDQRRAELEDLGYVGRKLEEKLADELFGMTRDMIAAGQDPAERVYALAKRRGFKAGEKATTDKLKKLAAGAAASNGTATARGKGPDNGLTWGAVAKLKGAARDAAFAKLRQRERGH